MEKRWDAWIESELRRFHRGISMTLLFLATALLTAEMFRFTQPQDRQALTLPLLTVGILLFKLAPSLRRRNVF